MRAQFEAWLHQTWAKRGLVSLALSPLSLLFLAISQTKRKKATPKKLPVPVVVVGNIYVGGTGKTPVTIALVRALEKKGWHPGVVSRGFGRKDEAPHLVTPTGNVDRTGDEPLLIAQETRVPVCVARNRYQAARTLMQAHPRVDIIISDDGLQHYALDRDVELAVVGTRGLGNGWVLPAGPLRRPPSRLDEVDAIVLNTENETIVKSRTPRFATSSCFGSCSRLCDGRTMHIDALSQKIAQENATSLAAAGIAAPQRFFSMLRAHALTIDRLALPDHYDYRENPFAHVTQDYIFITCKDAVKCAQHEVIRKDPRIWVVSLEVHLPSYLIDLVDEKARLAQQQRTSQTKKQ